MLPLTKGWVYPQIYGYVEKTFVRLGFSGRVNVTKGLRVFQIFFNLRPSG